MADFEQQLLMLQNRQPHTLEVPRLQEEDDEGLLQVNLTCIPESLQYWSKGPPFRIVVSLACCLSIVGALLIILSYALFKSLRSRARLVLVHLSVMDLGVGLMNLLGSIIHFDSYYVHEAPAVKNNLSSINTEHPNTNDLYAVPDSLMCEVYRPPNSVAIRRTCIAQAFLAHYFTYSSVLWTIALAAFIYFVIVHYRQVYVKHILHMSYVLCYGLPLIISLWLLFTGRLGYSPANGLWCSIVLEKPGETKRDTFAAFFGYDLWIYLAFVVVPIFFVAVKLFIREKIIQTKTFLPEAETRFWEALYILDYKFLLIPLFFFFLRIWACIQLMIHYYIDLQVPLGVHVTLNYLSNIGDSSQGFANAILFVLFTKKVRVTLFSLSYWKRKICFQKKHRTDDMSSSIDSSLDNQPIESEILTPSKFTESLPRSMCIYVDNSRRHATIN